MRLCISASSSSAVNITTSPNSFTVPPKAFCNGLPAATFIAKSRVIMPLPASPAAANIIGTPIGNVPSTKNSCTGALPVNLEISRLSLRRLIVLCVWPAPFSTNSLTSKSSSIASAASHLGGLSVGGCSIVTVFASASMATSRTISASRLPASSLSGQTTKSLPLNGVKSNLSAFLRVNAPAPPRVHVAGMPASINAWAHFSPSTQTTRCSFKMFGILYRGRTSGAFGYLTPGTQGLNSFLPSMS